MIRPLFAACLFPAVLAALPAQQHGATRIGLFVWQLTANEDATLQGIRRGLADGRVDATFLQRDAGGEPLLASRQLEELANARCDLVFALGTPAARLARQRLRDVPIVFAAVANPVADELVPTWSGTQGNLCGASNWIEPESVLEVFRLAVPGLRRLGMLRSERSSVVSRAELAAMRAHLQRPGAPAIELFEAVVPHVDLVEPAVRELLLRGVDAIWIGADGSVHEHLDIVQRSLDGKRVPLVTTATAALRGAPAHTGAIAGAVPDFVMHGRRSAALAVAILRGGKQPHELPVDRLSGCLLVANLAAARRQRLQLPLSLLALADEILEPEPADAGR